MINKPINTTTQQAQAEVERGLIGDGTALAEMEPLKQAPSTLSRES